MKIIMKEIKNMSNKLLEQGKSLIKSKAPSTPKTITRNIIVK